MIPNLSSEVGVAFTLLRDTNSRHDTSLQYSCDFVMPVPLSMHHQDWGKQDDRKVKKRREVAGDQPPADPDELCQTNFLFNLYFHCPHFF